MTRAQFEDALRSSETREVRRHKQHARERLEAAKTDVFAGQVPGDLVNGVELNRAIAVAEEWGLVGRRGGAP